MKFLENVWLNVYNLGLTFFIWNFNLLSFCYSDTYVICYGHKSEEWGLLERIKINIGHIQSMAIHEWNETSYVLVLSAELFTILDGKFARSDVYIPQAVRIGAKQMFPTPGILHLLF